MGLLANEDRPMAVPPRGGRFGDCHLTVGVDRLHAGRGDHHGERNLLPQNGGGHLTGRGCTDHVWGRKTELRERPDVVGDGEAFLAG